MANHLHIPVTAPAPGLGLGLAALGRPAYINVGHGADVGRHPSRSALRQQAHDVLDAAWASGVRYFDAARSYGEAEAFLGSWLTSRSIEPNQVAVGSKWGYRYTADWATAATVHEVKEHSLAMLDRQWPQTQTHLGSYLDLYQIHSATLDSGALTDKDVLDGLRRLADTGIAIGLSTSGPAQAATIELALSIQRDDGTLLFDAVQATWNLLEPSAGGALRAAANAGLTVIVKEALANGRLTSHEPELARRLEPLAPGDTPDAIAIAAVLQQPWSSIVLSGAATIDHLHSNVRALDVAADLADAATDLAQPAAEYWDQRSRLAWT